MLPVVSVDRGIALQEDKVKHYRLWVARLLCSILMTFPQMQSLVLAAVLSLAAARPQLPAGDDDGNDTFGNLLNDVQSMIKLTISARGERCPVPQLPVLRHRQPRRLPRPSRERRPSCPHPQYHSGADSVLAAGPGIMII